MGHFQSITSDDASKAMLDGLTSMVRQRLRERILEVVEPEIEAAVDAALGQFKASIETYRDPLHMRDTVRVLIEKPVVQDRSAK